MPIQFIQPWETHQLRRSVLRPTQPLDEMEWPGDKAECSFHLGMWLGGHLVSIASFIRERNELLRGWIQYRVRGMATGSGHQGAGHGGALLRFGLDHARHHGADLVWCNAREAAIGFYAKEGFLTEGAPFLIEGIGTHQLMYLRL